MAKTKKKKTFFIVARAIIAILFLGIFFTFPFLNKNIDFVLAQILWYLSLVILFILGKAVEKSERKKTFLTYIGDSGLLPIITIFLSAFIINYYETKYDLFWAIFTFVAIGIPAVSFATLTYYKEEVKVSTEQLNKYSMTSLKVTVLWWLLDLLFISIVKNWKIWPFIFGFLALLLIFYNLAISFLYKRKNSNFFLLQDFILGIGLTIYLLYIIPDEKLQGIMITVISAVYGGLITLVGVAWTIKESHNSNRNAHLKSIKPLFYAVMYNNVDYTKSSTVQMSFRPKIDVVGWKFSILGAIRNSDKSDLIIEKISIDGLDVFPDYATPNVVQKSKVVEIAVLIEKEITKENSIYLFVFDIEGNELKYKIILGNEENEIARIEEVVYNG